jgi:hypothetical protein
MGRVGLGNGRVVGFGKGGVRERSGGDRVGTKRGVEVFSGAVVRANLG